MMLKGANAEVTIEQFDVDAKDIDLCDGAAELSCVLSYKV